MEKSKPGTIKWFDLTIPNASEVSKFYQEVVGWTEVPLSMGEYDDYCMNIPETEETVAGICHARGKNAGQPAQWMMYIIVANLDQSLAACERLGGKRVGEVRQMGEARYCIIQDNAGALVTLYQE